MARPVERMFYAEVPATRASVSRGTSGQFRQTNV